MGDDKTKLNVMRVAGAAGGVVAADYFLTGAFNMEQAGIIAGAAVAGVLIAPMISGVIDKDGKMITESGVDPVAVAMPGVAAFGAAYLYAGMDIQTAAILGGAAAGGAVIVGMVKGMMDDNKK